MSITLTDPALAIGYKLSKVILANDPITPSSAFTLKGINGASVEASTPLTIATDAVIPVVVAPAGTLFHLATDNSVYVSNGVSYDQVVNNANQVAIVPKGATFPGFPSHGDFFYLNAVSGTHQIGMYVFGKDSSDDTVDMWNNLQNTNNIVPATGVIPVPHGHSFPSVAPQGEFPEDRGFAVGLVGSVFNLTKTFEGNAPGLYYNAGTYLTGFFDWLPVNNLTATPTSFATGMYVGSKFPTAADYSGVIYSPHVELVAGMLFYKTLTDAQGAAGLYAYENAAWTLALL